MDLHFGEIRWINKVTTHKQMCLFIAPQIHQRHDWFKFTIRNMFGQFTCKHVLTHEICTRHKLISNNPRCTITLQKEISLNGACNKTTQKKLSDVHQWEQNFGTKEMACARFLQLTKNKWNPAPVNNFGSQQISSNFMNLINENKQQFKNKNGHSDSILDCFPQKRKKTSSNKFAMGIVQH